MIILNFTKVETIDWFGNAGVFKIMSLVEKEDGKYSCTFKNSIGDYEKIMVAKEDLRP